MTDRAHDLVLYGATGFVGRLTAAYLARAAPAGTRIALGGRSRERLEAVRATLPAPADTWPLVVADSSDEAALADLAASATVVVTTVGPYAKFGLPLVRACAAAGTHYADLTGEVLFVRDSIDSAHDAARRQRRAHRARVRLRLGPVRARRPAGRRAGAAADGAGELAETVLCLVSSRGGVSGGTLDSVRNQVDEIKADGAKRAPHLRPLLAEPGPGRRARPRPRVRLLPHPPRAAAGRALGRPVRHGLVQHPGRAAEQRADRPPLRPVVPLPRGDGRRRQPGRTAAGLRRRPRRRRPWRPASRCRRRAGCSTGCCPRPARARARRPARAATSTPRPRP